MSRRLPVHVDVANLTAVFKRELDLNPTRREKKEFLKVLSMMRQRAHNSLFLGSQVDRD